MSSMFKGRSLSKVVAVFRQPEAAELAREKVKSAAGLDDGQVRVVGPHDTPWIRQPEPPRESIARAALRVAVCLHGAAADRLVERSVGPIGVGASEIADAARDILNRV